MKSKIKKKTLAVFSDTRDRLLLIQSEAISGNERTYSGRVSVDTAINYLIDFYAGVNAGQQIIQAHAAKSMEDAAKNS